MEVVALRDIREEKKSHITVGVGPDSLTKRPWLAEMRHSDILMKNAAPF
jgi:hypothetical protein